MWRNRFTIPPLYFLAPMFFHWWIRLVVLSVWYLRRKVVVLGREHIARARPPAIFVANHTSDWDGPMIRAVFPMFSKWGPMFYAAMTREGYTGKNRHLLSRLVYGGFIFKLLGAYPVYKGTGHLRTALPNMITILNDGGPVVIFPEGKESKTGEIRNFKMGAAYLAAVTGVPCIPVAISGFNAREVENGVAPKGTLTVSFGTPVFFPKGKVNEPETKDLEDFTAILKEAVESGLEAHACMEATVQSESKKVPASRLALKKASA